MKTDRSRAPILVLGAVLALVPAFALAADDGRAVSRTDLGLVVGTGPSLMATAQQTLTLPDLGLDLKGGAELTPVSVNLTAETVWTPVPFLQLLAGASAGTGWTIPLGTGLGTNAPKYAPAQAQAAGNWDQTVTSVSGLLGKLKAGAAFQMDAAALVPGDWNHVVFRTYHEANYQALTGQDSGVSWVWAYQGANTAGQNCNGWNYYGNYFLGYRMPLWLDLVGFLAEENLLLYGRSGGADWGDDLPSWTFGPLAEAQFGTQWTLTLALQFQTLRQYQNGTGGRGFYQYRQVDRGNPYTLGFSRAALIVGYRL